MAVLRCLLTKVAKNIALLCSITYNSFSMPHVLSDRISAVENLWLAELSLEVERLFSAIWLPSHDLSHHLRVWKFAKELLFAYHKGGYDFSAEFIETLAFAVFFHDTGLSVTSVERHGLEGKLFAEKFLQDRLRLSGRMKTELFQAIILHDDKNYKNEQKIETPPGIYHILTLADDLDALGCLGILRYLEIYRERGVKENILLGEIEKNLCKRYTFLSHQLLFDAALLLKHKLRFEKGLNALSNIKPSHVKYFFESFSKHEPFEILIEYTGREEFLKYFFHSILNELTSIENEQDKI